MAHSSRGAPLFYQDGKRIVQDAAERLDGLRAWAERSPQTRRHGLEQDLDQLRGMLNRARALLEGVRMAGDDAGSIATARATASAAVSDLMDGLERLETQLPIAA